MALNEGALGPVSTRRNNAPVDFGVTTDTFPYYEFPSDQRLPDATWAPLAPINALRIMNLTDPNGHPVTFMPGEALPAWAVPSR